MNAAIIAAARRHQYTLDVASQIVGIPGRLIAAIVAPCHEVDEVPLYSMRNIVRAFRTDPGLRLIRKLHQNQLKLYRDCAVSWRDDLGVVHAAEGAVVELRGRRAEITLRDGARIIQSRAEPAFSFSGTAV